jgi:predicted DNA-binding transcriptional regulator AlpA
MSHDTTTRPRVHADPLLVSVDELSRMLGISPRSIWRRLSAGELVEPVRIGNCTRWRLDEVKAWIAAGCPSSAQLDRRGR